MDRQRLAQALAYEQQRRSRLANVIPTAQPGDPEVIPEQGVRSRLENLSSGLGQGGVNTLEGLRQLVTSPIETGRAMVEGGVEMIRDPALIAEALRQMGQTAASGPLGLGEVIGESLNPVRVRSRPLMQELDVYHGSPHRFEEFDASKIGTGEGAQAYGHGIYFAENPSVAEGYRKVLGEQQNPYKANVAMSRMAALVDEFDGDVEKAADRFMQSVYETPKTKAKMRQNLIDEFQTYSPKGQLYKADLPDEMIDRMLDWDKPLSQQSPAVRETVMRYMNVSEKQLPADMRVGQVGDKYVVLQDKPPLPGSTFGIGRSIVKGPRAASEQEAVDAYWNSLTGKDFYETIGKDLGQNADASDYMRQLGIPGIKYLDAGSRGQGGSGTRNFVVFPGEEKKVKILERDGQKINSGRGNQFPVVKAGDIVDGLKVRPETANVSSIVELPRTATVIEARATKAGRNLPDLEAELAKEGFTLQETPLGSVEVYGKKLGADPTVPQKLETVKEGGKGAAIQLAKNLQRKEAADIEKAKTRSPFDEFKDFGNLDDYLEDRPELLETLMRRKIDVPEPEIADVSPSFKNRNYRVRFETGEEFSVNDVSAKTLAELKDQVKRDQIYDQIPAQLQGQTVRDLIETLGWQERSPQYIRDVLTGKRKLKLDE